MKRLDKGNIEDIIALTPMQEGMLFHYLKEPEKDHYFEQLSLKISGRIDIDCFKQAWNFVIETNEMLRTVFRWEKLKSPTQIVLKDHTITLRYHDFSFVDTVEKTGWIEEIKTKKRKETFDLREVPFRVTLCKVEKDKYEMIISNHHILYDGWSTGIILRDFVTAYTAFSNKKEPVKPFKTKFKEFIRRNREQARKNEEETFWEGYLKGFDSPSEFSIKRRTRKEKEIKSSGNYQIRVNEDTRNKLERYVKKYKITVAALLYGGWGILLQKYNNNEDVIFGTTVSGRRAQIKGIEDMVGLFINTLPLRVRTKNHSNENILDFLCRINQTLQVREDYEISSLVNIKEYSDIGSHEELFDTVLVIENYPLDPLLKQENSPLSFDSYSIFERTHYDLTVGITLSDDDMVVNVYFQEELFEKNAIERLTHHYISVIKNLTKNSGQTIKDIELLSAEEKQQILFDFNNRDADYPQNITIHELFEEQVERAPDHIALVDTNSTSFISYKELNKWGNRLARILRKRGVHGDTVVGLLMERRLDVMVAVMGVLKAGGAYLPIVPHLPAARQEYMIRDAAVSVVLSHKNLADRLNLGEKLIQVDEKSLLTAEGNDSNPEPLSHSQNTAYVIYTSGSTGQPKGVMIEHSQLVNFIYHMYNRFDQDLSSDDNCLSLTEMSFDVSVCELFLPLPFGASIVFLAEEAKFNVDELSKVILERKVTFAYLPPGLLPEVCACLREGPPGLRLNKLLVGVEPIQDRVLEEYLALNPRMRILNGYGPTETTICATMFRYRSHEPEGRIVPIGSPLSNNRVVILDKGGSLVPVGVPGELCVSGDGVGRGYLNNSILTAEKFVPNPRIPGERMYNTGDLTRWLENGNIEFIGRIDQQVKVRGYRIEPGEIENQLLKVGTVKKARVIARQGWENEKYLCGYIVSHEKIHINIEELKKRISKHLPAYMIPSYIIQIEEIPVTAHGKLDIKALPEPEIVSGKKYIAPKNEREALLVEIWSEVLAIDKERIGIDDNFFELGGHSLKATGLIGRIHKAFDIEMPLAQLFKSPTVRGVSLYMADMDKNRHSPIEWVEKKEFYTLSSAQKRLFVIHRMDPSNITYNMPGIMKLEEWVERKRLEEAFKKLINRHESLRTSFEIIDGEPIQKIHKAVDFKIEYEEVSDSLTSYRQVLPLTSQFIRPFDLSQPSLLRVGLVETGEDEHILVVDMHHIISDGISVSILIKEFTALYIGKEMPELSLQYKDFSHWQNQRLTSTKIKEQEAYWLEQFEGEIPVLDLPTDYVRPSVQQFEGGRVRFEAGEAETAQLRQLTLATGTTPFMVLLAVFNVMFSKLSSQEDIVVGIPTAGRSHRDLENIIGIFINTLALRNYPSAQDRFSEFLTEVKRNCLEAFENQDYQYEDLVEAVVTDRDLSRNSLFDVMLVLQNMERQQVEIPGLKLIPCDYESHMSKFDITLTAVEETKRFEFSMTYSTAIFNENTIKRFSNYFKRILTAVLKESGQGISEIDILSEDEKIELLYGFNTTIRKYPGEKTIQRLFEEQVEEAPGNIAVIGTAYSGTGKVSEGCPAFTYRELNEKSNQLARLLRANGVMPDTIVGLMVRPSLDMIIGILAILKTGGAYLPIDPLQSRERVTYMLNDSQAAVLLTDRHLGGIIDFTGPIITLGDTALYKGDRRNLKKVSRPANVVYTIYTSGTTGKSKGALIENKNLVNYVYWFRRKANLTGNDRTLLTSSFGFDLGYTSIFSSILSSCQLHMISRETYLSPEDLTDYIARHRITYIKVTPSLFTTIVESSGFSRESCRTLRLVILGGEEIKLKDVEKAHVIGPHIEVMNHYGPTEATIGCVAQFIDFNAFNDYKKRPTIGYPIDNMKVSILDNGLRMVPTGVPGELCVSGAGVIRGYLNQPELTAGKFDQDLQDLQDYQDEKGKKKRTGKYSFTSLPLYPSTSLYRTGDLARWSPGGGVEFLGRFDSQVKIRGYRIELGEIESRLLTHEAIKEAVVIDRKHTAGDKYLCAYIVFNRAYRAAIEGTQKMPENAELREYLAAALPDVMVPSYFVTLEKIPLTPNGKLNRRLLPEPGTEAIAADYTYTAPRDRVEEKLAELWQEILEPSGERKTIGIDDNFFRRGGHSLKAIMLVSRIHKTLNVKMALTEIFKTPTIRGLSAHIKHIKAPAEDRYIAIEPVEKKEYYSLSSAQKRLFILHRFDEMGTGYNMPRVVDIEGDLDRNRLEDTFKELIERHESLRTSFEMIDGEPVQKIHESDDVAFEIGYYQSLVNGQWSSVINNFIQPFDLAQAPLLRVGLITGAAGGAAPSILMVDMHHIISDAVSRDLFIRDFMALYSGEVVPDLKIRYKDYSEWQDREKEGDEIKQQEDFWIREFKGEAAVIHLPTDFGRPAIQSFEGKQFRFFLDNEETDPLRKLAMEEKATLNMVLMTIYNILLSKISGQEDIVIGLPIVGRRHADLEPVIGMFVNTLALRNYPSREKRFIEFLREVRERTLTGLENQDYQFEDLVDKAAVNRDASRNPLFDVMFVMQDTDIPKMEVPGLKLNPRKYESGISKFDLTFGFEEVKEKLLFCVDYSTKLFAEETIVTFTKYFKKIVSAVLNDNDRDIRIGEIEIISEAERRQLLYDFNDTEAEYPSEKRLHEIFEEQVEKTPDNIALVSREQGAGSREIGGGAGFPRPGNGGNITYRELDEISDQLARRLRERGVKPNAIVGIMVERSLEMVIGIFGILKAGGAYLPIDPVYPEERINYMFQDSNAEIFLTTRSLAEKIALKKKIIYLEDYKKTTVNQESSRNAPFYRDPAGDAVLHASQPGSSSLAYVIYTSGSTGKPKGVMIQHGSLVNRLHWMQRAYSIGTGDVILQKTTFTFDVSVWELFWWSIQGASLCLLRPGDEKNPEAIIEAIKKHKVTTIHFVPSMFNVFLHYLEAGDEDFSNIAIKKLSSLRQVFASGEALEVHQVKRFNRLLYDKNGTRLVNLYGPTEATIDVSFFNCSGEDHYERIPIGKPIDNIQLIIVDNWLKLQSVGVAGELCIAGVGLARGYLNKPELTAEKFDQDFQDYQDDQDEKGKKKRTGKYSFTSTSLPLYPSTSLYRTGDLARWLPDENIEFLGRMDHQIKIRGFRVELGEIETQLLTNDKIKEAVVIAAGSNLYGVKGEENGDKCLCAYIVPKEFNPNEKIDLSGLKNMLSKDLPDFMIPSYFVQLQQIPLTSSGKVDRKALPAPELKAGETYVAPRDEIEEKLAEIWSEVLGIEKGVIGIHDNFFDCGGHSLKAISVGNKIHKTFEVAVIIQDLFKHPTIAGTSRLIQNSKITRFREIEKLPEQKYYELSYSQKRLWYICKTEPHNTLFNMPVEMTLYEAVDEMIVRKVLEQLTARHESLRTSFKEINKEPVQVIEPKSHVKLNLEIFDWTQLDETEQENRRSRLLPEESSFIFNLEEPPLFRVKLVKCKEEEYDLVFNMHHIISDGWSLEILKQEFNRVYEAHKKGIACDMEPLKLQYKDYAAWQNLLLADEEQVEKANESWKNQLSGNLPVLNLPYDFSPGLAASKESASYRFVIPGSLTSRLREMAAAHRASVFMVLLAGFNLLLSQITGQKDIIMAIPAAARQHEALKNIIGMFVNTLILRNKIIIDESFIDFFKRLQDNTFKALEYQGIPLELIFGQLKIKYPDISVFFNMINIGNTHQEEITNLECYHIEKVQDAKFDIVCYLTEYKNGIEINCHYFRDRFKPVTIKKLMDLYRIVLNNISGEPAKKIGEYSLTGKKKKRKLRRNR